jgi:thymidylate kinase
MTTTLRARIGAVEGIDGGGKSTLVRSLVAALAERGEKAHAERLSAEMGRVFRGLPDRTVPAAGRYQDVLPGAFRRAAYVVDAVLQFEHRGAFYDRHDWVLFDRWLPTYDVYCDGLSRHDQWWRRVAATLPTPAVLLHVKVSPEVAVERLRRRGDWTVDNWSGQELLDDLRRLDERYEELLADRPTAVRLDGDRGPAEVLAAALAALDASKVEVNA